MTDNTYTLINIKPAHPGLVVRDPLTLQPLKPEGECKPLDGYWTRRYSDGDVIPAHLAVINPASTDAQAPNKPTRSKAAT